MDCSNASQTLIIKINRLNVKSEIAVECKNFIFVFARVLGFIPVRIRNS